MAKNKQSTLFRGIYEFEDPAGTLLAAKAPAFGTADLYDGTAIVVKPNQCAMLVYKGEIAEILKAGLHRVSTQNFPLITRIANWKFGFRSPLRCEIWFFSGNTFTSRRWGTSHPVMHDFEDVGMLGLRAFGQYNVAIQDPRRLFLTLIGSRNDFDIMDLDEFIQAQILELLPQAMAKIKSLRNINKKQKQVAENLRVLVKKELKKYGILLEKIQVMSIVPPQEVIEAMDARTAMGVLGDQKKFLLYKAANSLDALGEGTAGSDSMQMMMGLMLGKGLMGADVSKEKELLPVGPPRGKTDSKKAKHCHNCGAAVGKKHKYCSECGAEQ